MKQQQLDGQQQLQQAMSYEKLFDMLIKGNDNGQAIINDEGCLNSNKWNDGFNKSENNGESFSKYELNTSFQVLVL